MVENTGKDKVFNYTNLAIMLIYALVTMLPLLHVLASAFSDPNLVNKGLITIFPKGFTLENFIKVFKNDNIITGYLNTIFYTVVGTIVQLVLQFTIAYPLSRKDLKHRNVFAIFLVITMFVSGGMIPTYLVVNAVGLINTRWAMIIPGCVGVFNVIVIRTYIQTAIPWELQEASMIDGCTNIRIFMQIVLPLCKPIIAVMALYAIVGYWNSYFNSLIYLTEDKFFPLQRVLQSILVSNSNTGIGGSLSGGEQSLLSETLKHVTIVVASAPILFIYPFFQRFFEKGMMVGGLKG